jgi:prevent-host-death family protein
MNVLSVRVPLAEAKNKLSELLDRVSQGEEITITRHDRDIARLIPASRPSRETIQRAIEAMTQLRKGTRASVAEIVAWKNEGRR